MLKRTLLFALILVGLNSCQQEEEVKPKTNSTDSFDNSKNPFRLMQTIPQDMVGSIVKEKKKREIDGENASTNCSVEDITVTKDFSSLTLLEKGTDGLIYPGSLLTAESVLSGNYHEILGVTKRHLNIVFDIRGMDGAKNKWIVPTYSNYVNALGEMEAKTINGSQPAYVDFTASEVKSEDHLKVAIGANFSIGKFSSISSDFNLEEERSKTVTVGKFIQEYFTVTADRPADGIYIEEYPDPSIFGSYSPMYVSELTYGRVALFFAESTHSSKEVKAALEASFSFLGKGEGSVSTEQKNILNSSRIKALIHGGSSGDAAYIFVNGYEGLKNYVGQGGEMTNDSRGAIISYKLRNLSNHTTAVINLSADYNEYDCVTTLYADGEFIRDAQTQELFQVFDGKLRYIPDARLLNTVYDFHYSMIIDLPHSSILSIPRGENFPADMALVHYVPTGTIYLKENDTIRPIASESAFNKYHFNWRGYVNFYNLDLYTVNPELIKY